MRVRSDSWWEAGRKRAVLLKAVPNPLDEPAENWSADWLDFLRAPDNEARPGDVWVLRQAPQDKGITSYGGTEPDWPIVGYGLVCPAVHCDAGVHLWDHAHDCPGRYHLDQCKNANGASGCWTWTGSPEDDTLTGNPSLYVMGPESGHHGCGWHGFLRSGQMVPC